MPLIAQDKITFIPKELEDIATKVFNNERLSKEDGITLFESSDVLSIGYLANFARLNRLQNNEEKDYVYWINNHHLNLTNICEGNCKFCAYKKEKDENGAFLFSIDQAIEHLGKNINKDASEIHIVSALNPKCDLEYYVKLLKACKKELPNIHIQAFTAVEIDYIAKVSALSIKETILELKKAGLGSLPGGGAEIFSSKVREQVCPEKISGQKWLEIMETAHNLGLKSNVTMLTGINESNEDKIDHMLQARALQDKTGGFMSFIPLFCHYENTKLDFKKNHTGVDIIKTYAISRLMIDNIKHLKAFWIQVGVPISQLTTAFGVDDIDGTVVEEKITHFAGAKTSQAMSKNELIKLIKNAGKIPVERDTLYNILKVYN